MLLDIKKYLSRETVEIDDSFSLNLSERPFCAELTLHKPVAVRYTCTTHGTDGLYLTLEIAMTADAQCARCLKNFEYKMSISPSFVLTKADYECDDPELPFTQGGKLDLDELCYSEILLELPSVVLCNASCKGLCPVCGKPLEEGCDCDRDAGDGRQSIFKQLLS